MTTDPTNRKRRRFRLSIRGLIVLVLLAGCVMGWWVNSAKVQRQAVAIIERRGGSVSYDYQYREVPVLGLMFDVTAECPWPGWLVNLMGIDGLCTVVEAHSGSGEGLAYQDLDDAELALVGRLRHVRWFRLISSVATDVGLRHLAGMERLQTLTLMAPKASGAGLACVDGMGRLDDLFIDGLASIQDDDLIPLGRRVGLKSLHVRVYDGSITDAGLAHLSSLIHLKRLDLNGVDITTEGLIALRGMTRLEKLFLRNCKRLTGLAPLRPLVGLKEIDLDGSTTVGDDGLAVVSGFDGLVSLGLEDTSVGDLGLAHVRGLRQLSSLDLDGTKVTDLGLAQIAGMPGLDSISLERTSVGDVGAAHLSTCPNLGQLNVRGLAGLTDVGFARLMGLKKLYRIDLTGAPVSTAAVNAARLARPGPRIFH